MNITLLLTVLTACSVVNNYPGGIHNSVKHFDVTKEVMSQVGLQTSFLTNTINDRRRELFPQFTTQATRPKLIMEETPSIVAHLTTVTKRPRDGLTTDWFFQVIDASDRTRGAPGAANVALDWPSNGVTGQTNGWSTTWKTKLTIANQLDVT